MIGFFRSLSPNTAGALMGLAAFAVFSFHDVVVKILGATYSTFQIVFFSALLSFPMIAGFMISEDKPGKLRPVHPWWLALRCVSGTTAGVCAFYAFSKLPLTQVYAFVFSSPLLITLLAIPILGETIHFRRGIAVLVGLIGVLIVLRPGSSPISAGHIAALGAAFFGALNAIIVRKIGSDERSVVMILYPMLTNLVLAALALPFVYVDLPIEDLGLFAVVAALVLVAMGFMVAAYRLGDAIIVAPMQYSQIVWAAIFGAALFGEYPDLWTVVGVGVIALSGAYILKRESTTDVSENSPVLSTRTRIGYVGLRVGSLMRGAHRGE